jgi:hypothetical protein
MNWFECKVSFDKTMDNGMQKSVKELYLVDAFTFTDAEAMIVEQLSSRGEGNLTVSDIRRAKIAEMFIKGEGDRFYRGKIVYITLDEKSGKERRSTLFSIVRAFDIEGAMKILIDAYKDHSFEVVSVAETAIMDIFLFSTDEKEDENSGESAED